jgi:hypothetical protein
MFDNSSFPSDRNSGDFSLNQVRDGLASLTHRVGEIESLLSRKVFFVLHRWIDLSALEFARKKPARAS